MINWDRATREEYHLANGIAKRYEKILKDHTDICRTEMDIIATHISGCPLLLKELLNNANDFDFIHDVSGIHRHLDRETGKLENFFIPRFAANY